MQLEKLTKALEHPKAKEILDILNNLTGMQLLFGIEQVKNKRASIPTGQTKLLLKWILEDQEWRIKLETKTTSTGEIPRAIQSTQNL